MMIIKNMVSAINAAAKEIGIKGFYHGFNPAANKLPFVCYTIISDVPALNADDTEIQSKISIRIHIVTKDGAYEKIYAKINKILLELGFSRVQATDIIEDGLKIKAMDYITGVETI